MTQRIIATADEIKARRKSLVSLQTVVYCHECEKWRNFTMRKDGEAKPEDMGLCEEYSRVKTACGYCDKGKEKKDE